MRWFKHLAASHTDEKLLELIHECGMEGYGFWWMILEIVAGQMDKTDRCHATYSLSQWAHMLFSHHHKVRKMLGKLADVELVTVDSIGNKVRVTIPNLLKYRDEYTKKSGQGHDKDRSKRTEAEEDAEIKMMNLPLSASSENATVSSSELAPRMTRKEASDLYVQTFGKLLPGMLNQEILDLCNTHPPERIREAFRIAAINGATSFNYIKSVLEGGKREGGDRRPGAATPGGGAAKLGEKKGCLRHQAIDGSVKPDGFYRQDYSDRSAAWGDPEEGAGTGDDMQGAPLARSL